MDLKAILGTAHTVELEKAINEAVSKDYVTRADFNEKNEALKTANLTIADRDKQIADLGETAKGNEELTAQIAKLQEANKAVGFHLKSDFWGMGLAHEAASAVINHAFSALKATCIYAGHNPLNTNSKKVLEKLGFNYAFNSLYPPTGLMHPTYILKNSAKSSANK